MLLTIKVQGQDVTVVKEFVYLGSLIHSSTGSTCDISHRSAITRAATKSLENQIWRSRLAISTKLKLYNTCILRIFLYGSDCWVISKTDARKIDALNHWCLRMLLSIKWYQFVRNDDVRRLTKQPKLTAIIHPFVPAYPLWGYYVHERQRRCQEDPVSLPSGRLEKTTRSSPHYVAQHRPTGSETTTPDAPRSSRFGSEPPSVEDDVDVWRYAIVSCIAETMTTTIRYGKVPVLSTNIITLYDTT